MEPSEVHLRPLRDVQGAVRQLWSALHEIQEEKRTQTYDWKTTQTYEVMRVNQCLLQTGNTFVITWAPRDLVKVGKKLKAGNDARIWTVIAAYRNIILDEKELRTDWKVGGL